MLAVQQLGAPENILCTAMTGLAKLSELNGCIVAR